jgi:hypothetical protein
MTKCGVQFFTRAAGKQRYPEVTGIALRTGKNRKKKEESNDVKPFQMPAVSGQDSAKTALCLWGLR